ncbi:MAG: family 20 glycosylhydrolase, partial [Urechidicola sp.]|nr:family 20 glycosylhydrolase [Urechidicola sp.]
MNTILKFTLTILIVGFSFVSCQNEVPKTDLTKESLIPKPLNVSATNSSFLLNEHSNIQTSETEGFYEVGIFLSEKINAKTKLALDVNSKSGVILINKVEKYQFSNNESYELHITKDSIVVNALSAEGAFRAVQTLRQLIPFKSVSPDKNAWAISTGTISDEPNYNYRGAMLDVSRHFFSVEDVKKYIDVIAYYKMNTLHLHLSDDQGWRLEIKSWPELANIGGLTEIGGEDGGFFTQYDYTEIVNYAAKHHIVVIPEIDMPGHTHAASTAYPFLNGAKDYIKILDQSNPDRKSLLYTGIEVGFSTFDTRKE